MTNKVASKQNISKTNYVKWSEAPDDRNVTNYSDVDISVF